LVLCCSFVMSVRRLACQTQFGCCAKATMPDNPYFRGGVKSRLSKGL
jgi:hypothetical protein